MPAQQNDLRVSEIFESIQGEGPSAGTPCTFLRLAHCNLRCRWCDTRYSWDFEQYDYDREVSRIAPAFVAKTISQRGKAHLVVTGGEPLLQRPALETLLIEHLPQDVVVEVETNGTVHPGAPLLSRVNQWNVSPKLANSGEPRERRLVADVLRAFRETGRAWLKLVVRASTEATEIRSLVATLDWPATRVLLMPEAATPAALGARTPLVAELANEHGYQTSPRLHIERFGGERGR